MKENLKTKLIYFFTSAYFIIFIFTVLSKKQKHVNPPSPAALAYQKHSKYDCDSVRSGNLDAVKILRLEMMNQKFKKR